MQTLDLVSVLVNAGPAGLVVILYSIGWIVPKPGAERLSQDADRWRQLYESERASHEQTREAYRELVKTSSAAALEAAHTTEQLLEDIKARQREASA